MKWGKNRTRALYALLYTQAQDKTYRDETNYSLISIAVDYYRDTDDVRRKFLSYYYKGRVYFNAKDYLSATSCYMEAEQLADEVGDDYLVGLLYAELGRIYRLYYDYPKSLEGSPKLLETHTIFIILRHLLNIPIGGDEKRKRGMKPLLSLFRNNLSLPKHFIPNR